MSTSKKVVLFTSRPASIVLELLTKLRDRSYFVVLVVCAPGPNNRLNTTSIQSMGSQVSGIIDGAIDPPPVLCVTKMSQVETIYLALDPDLAVIFGFAYRITKKLLSHRSRFVNFHPAPLPMMRGSPSYPWLAMDPSIPMIATWHYMVEEVDQGNIIQEVEIAVPKDKRREMITAAEIESASNKACFASIHGVLELVEEGYEGQAQENASKGDAWALRPLSDDERTLKDDMDVEEVMRLGRALEGFPTRPLLRFNGGLYYIMRLTRLKEDGLKPTGTQKRVGSDLIQHFKGGAVRMAIRKV